MDKGIRLGRQVEIKVAEAPSKLRNNYFPWALGSFNSRDLLDVAEWIDMRKTMR